MDEVGKAAERSRSASYKLQAMPSRTRNRALSAIAEALEADRESIVAANRRDLSRSKRAGLSKALLKRLRYDSKGIEDSVQSIRALIRQEDPIGKVLSMTELDKGLILEKVASPIGVIAVIFEARPEALVQISALCIKSGNAVLLKGGSEAELTNRALADTIGKAIAAVDKGFKGAVQLMSTREEIGKLLRLDGLIDLIIPRGSYELVKTIQENTRIPVMGHAAGICHTYVDEDADLQMAALICYDAKCQYPAVCNAMETLLVHRKIAKRFLPAMAEKYREAGVELRGCARTREHIRAKKVEDDDWSTEYNDLILSIRIVDSLDEAIAHVNRYGSHHTDAIITDRERTAKEFMDRVDSSSVLWNCSTRFSDGYRYGLGAEVGISTNKIHARGPVGLEGLTIYKYRLLGKGHVVSDYSGKGARRFTHRRLK